MSNRQQRELDRMREQIEQTENDRVMYVEQKQWLFKQLGAQITFLLQHLVGGNEQQLLQDGKQQQDTAIETYGERNYFIDKLHEKNHQIEIMKLSIDEYQRRVRELESKEMRESELEYRLKTHNHDGQQIQHIQLYFQQQQQQQHQQHTTDKHNKQQLINKLSQVQRQRDVKIQQLQLMHKHIQHMKLMYSKQSQQLFIQNKAQIQRVIKQKDVEIASVREQMQKQKSLHTQLIAKQLTVQQQQLHQLNKKHRNDIDLISARYEKQKQEDEINKRNDNNSSDLITNEMQVKIFQLTTQLEQQSQLLQQKCQQIKDHQQSHHNLSNQLQQLNQQHNQLKQQNTKLTTANTFLQSKNIDLFSQLQKAIHTYQQSRTITNNRLQYLQNQLQQNKNLIQQYKKQVSTLNSTIQALRNQRSQKDIKLQSLDRQLQRTKNYNQILLTDVKSLSSDVKTLNTKIHELDQSNIEIKKAMFTSRRDLQNKKSKQVQSRILAKSALGFMTDRSNNSRNEQCCYERQKEQKELVGNSTNYNHHQQQQQLLQNHQSMRIERKDDSMMVDNSYSDRNNLSLLIDRKEKALALMGRKDNSMVMERSNNSMVMQRRACSPISSRTHSPLSDTEFRSNYRLKITEQLKKRRAKRQQQLKHQPITNKHHQQQQLQHVYSMQTTFSAMPMPNNIKPILSNKTTIQMTAKQRQERMNLFKKKNERLANYRQRIRLEKDALVISKKVYGTKGTIYSREDNATKVSQQFKHVLKVYQQKKSQLHESTKPTQNMLKNQQSKQILIEDNIQNEETSVRDVRNTHSSLEGEYQYEGLQLTFKPKAELEQDNCMSKIDSARSKTFIYNNLMTYGRSESLESKPEAKDNNRYLSLNSSFEDQNSITQEDIKSNKLRPSTKQRIIKQLPVHLLIGK